MLKGIIPYMLRVEMMKSIISNTFQCYNESQYQCHHYYQLLLFESIEVKTVNSRQFNSKGKE